MDCADRGGSVASRWRRASVAAPSAWRRSARLSPTTGTGSCFLADPVASGFPDCAILPEVRSPQTVVVAPDGKHVYVAGRDNLAGILVFSRDPTTGLLTQLAAPDGCLSGSGDDVTCTDVNGLGRPWSLAITDAGDRVHVASTNPDTVISFARDANSGELTQLSGGAGCIADSALGGCELGRTLDELHSVAVAPDAETVYTAGAEGVSVLVVGGGGGLTQPAGAAGCVDDDGAAGANDCADSRGLPGDDAFDVAVAPDGENVYAVGGEATSGFFTNGTSVIAMGRNPNGSLTEVPGDGGCASMTGANGCPTVAEFSNTRALTVSPDGAHLYVASDAPPRSIVGIPLAASGGLDSANRTCISHTAFAGCAVVGNLNSPWEIAVSADGASLYAATYGSQLLRGFVRDPATGALSELPAGGCVKDPTSAAPNCDLTGPAVRGSEGVTVSPDGAHVYATATPALAPPPNASGLAVYSREHPPDPPDPEPPAPPGPDPVDAADLLRQDRDDHRHRRRRRARWQAGRRRDRRPGRQRSGARRRRPRRHLRRRRQRGDQGRRRQGPAAWRGRQGRPAGRRRRRPAHRRLRA